MPTPQLELFIVKRFLDPALCTQLIARIDQKPAEPDRRRHQRRIFAPAGTCDLDGADPAVARVNEAISDLLGLPLELGEPIQGQRYAPGQEFKPYTDTFEPTGADYFLHCAERETAAGRRWSI